MAATSKRHGRHEKRVNNAAGFRRCNAKSINKTCVSAAEATLRICFGEVLTRPTAEDYIPPYGRAAAWRDGASAKPLTDHSVKSIRPALGYAGCIGFGGSGLGYDTTAGEGSRKGPMLFDK